MSLLYEHPNLATGSKESQEMERELLTQVFSFGEIGDRDKTQEKTASKAGKPTSVSGASASKPTRAPSSAATRQGYDVSLEESRKLHQSLVDEIARITALQAKEKEEKKVPTPR